MKKLLFIPLIVLTFQGNVLLAQEYGMLSNRTTDAVEDEPHLNISKTSVYNFDIYSKIENDKDITPELVGNHFLGYEIAKKLYLLDKTYLFESKLAPGNPATTTSIRKPVIYNSVKKIESYLKKIVRKKEMSTEQATNEFNKVLDVALNIIYQNTEAFENQIKRTDQSSDLLSLYTEAVHLNFMN